MSTYSNPDFLVIAITSPSEIPFEAERITDIFRRNAAHLVHIRKPEWDIERTASLLEQIPQEYHCRIKIHDHYSLLDRFHLAGVHLNSRNSLPPGNALSVSRSIHSIDQLTAASDYDYVTLSPIFDSISKVGYKGAFILDELKSVVEGKRVVALGGVTPEKFLILKECGFFGAAMLGSFWNIR